MYIRMLINNSGFWLVLARSWLCFPLRLYIACSRKFRWHMNCFFTSYCTYISHYIVLKCTDNDWLYGFIIMLAFHAFALNFYVSICCGHTNMGSIVWTPVNALFIVNSYCLLKQLSIKTARMLIPLYHVNRCWLFIIT